ncbi:hypothetical protein JW935_28430 [candidate division KSB1 bacterium]|nr:hypothetical protein [candidate division KSB1 bacterium]
MKKLVFFCLFAVLGLSCGLLEIDPSTFNLTVFPTLMDAINGQRCVLLVSVTGDKAEGKFVTIGAKADNCEILVENSQIVQGQVCEITIIPKSLPDKEITVSITGAREGFTLTKSVKINVVLGVDLAGPAAAEIRNRFVAWLAEQHPELGITPQTDWTGTLVTPNLTIIANYLYFSDTWEMCVSWHVMIPPHDWARIHLRRRFENMKPELAFEITSLQSAENPFAIDSPEAVTR